MVFVVLSDFVCCAFVFVLCIFVLLTVFFLLLYLFVGGTPIGLDAFCTYLTFWLLYNQVLKIIRNAVKITSLIMK